MIRLAVMMAALLVPMTSLAQGQLPAFDAQDLTGAERALPSGLGGVVNLLIVGFERDQTKTINSWIEVAERTRAKSPELDYYGIPVLPRGLGLIRRLIEGGLRDRYPAREQQGHMVVLYTDASRLRKSLGVGKGTAVRAVLVDRRGSVLWWKAGAADAAAEAELSAAVREAAAR